MLERQGEFRRKQLHDAGLTGATAR
jgi:hypothetical protein